MARKSFLSRIVSFVRGLFVSVPVEPRSISSTTYRPATKSELRKLGFSPTSRRYVPVGKRVSRSVGSISVRSYQQAQHGVRLEERAKQYKSGRVRKFPARYGVRFVDRRGKRIKGKIEYQEIPWKDLPRYFRRAKDFKHMQVAALGTTTQTVKYEEKGQVWRTIYIDGTDLRELYNRINTERGFEGFNVHNPPLLITLTFWKY